jgi:transposase
MSQKSSCAIAVVGIDIGKNSFHVVGHDQLGAIVLRQKWSRGQVEARLANLPPCLVGMEACVGASSQPQATDPRPQCPIDAGQIRAAV